MEMPSTVALGARRGVGSALRRVLLREGVREWSARIGLVATCVLLALGAAPRFATILDGSSRGLDGLAAIRLATVALQTVFYMFVCWFALARHPALRRARGWRPRAVALAGAFSIIGFGFLPPARGLPAASHLAAALLLLLGTALAAIVLTQLGRSLSLMPEARRLVTKGPYRFVRHPLYLVEELAALAGFLEAMSFLAALLLAVQIALQVARIRNEEAVLEAEFPEYLSYKARTARVIPGLW